MRISDWSSDVCSSDLMDVEAVREGQGSACLDVAGDLIAIDFGNVFVGQQDHDQIGNLDCFSHFLNLQAGVCRLVPGGAAFAQADDHIDAGFVQVERVRVALRAVTDDGQSFALDQGQVTIFIVHKFHLRYRTE